MAALPSLATAFAAALILTPIVRLAAVRLGRVAKPKADRWHKTPTALLGGVAVFAAVFGSAVLVMGPQILAAPLVIASAGMFLLGLVDDLVTLRPVTKLAGQIIAAAFVVFFGASFAWSGVQLVDQTLTILWLVGITNAFNLLDNMDGLCAGIGLIACLGWLASHATADASASSIVLTAAILGALAGFLVYNFSPASIFLGDSGSMFVGFAVAGLTLGDGAHTRNVVSTVAVPVLILLIPIFDTVLVTMARQLSGRSVSVGGTDHSSHRLVALGFSERQAVLILYGLAATSSTVALLASRYYADRTTPVIGMLLVAMVLLGVYLARVRVYDDQEAARLQPGGYTPLLVRIGYRRRVFEILLDVILIAASYAAAYQLRFEERAVNLYGDIFAQSLPVVIGLKILSLHICGAYQGVWRYFSLADLGRFLKGTLLGSILTIMTLVLLYRFDRYSRGVFVIDAMLLLLLLVGSRVSFRLIDEFVNRNRTGRRVLIYGAGDGGALLVRELLNNRKYGDRPVGFIDDDPRKDRRHVQGLPVLGGPESCERIIRDHRIGAVIVSTPKLDDVRRRSLIRICEAAEIPLLSASFAVTPMFMPDEPRELEESGRHVV